MQFTGAALYGAQPTAVPPATRSPEQAAAPRPKQQTPRANDTPDDPSGRRAVLIWVVLVGAAIALGWVSVTGAVRVGK